MCTPCIYENMWDWLLINIHAHNLNIILILHVDVSSAFAAFTSGRISMALVV